MDSERAGAATSQEGERHRECSFVWIGVATADCLFFSFYLSGYGGDALSQAVPVGSRIDGGSMMSTAQHAEWLSLLDISGPFLDPPLPDPGGTLDRALAETGHTAKLRLAHEAVTGLSPEIPLVPRLGTLVLGMGGFTGLILGVSLLFNDSRVEVSRSLRLTVFGVLIATLLATTYPAFSQIRPDEVMEVSLRAVWISVALGSAVLVLFLTV